VFVSLVRVNSCKFDALRITQSRNDTNLGWT